MAIAEMFLWWYSSGWKVFVSKLKTTLENITDFFSMGSLVRTLFKPYRQISAATASDNQNVRNVNMIIIQIKTGDTSRCPHSLFVRITAAF